VTLGAIICGSFSSERKKATLRSSQCRPAFPIHRARRPIRDAAGRRTEGGAMGVNGRDIVLAQIQ